jgi:glycosyltransferase involved in cell wall biosynthesis
VKILVNAVTCRVAGARTVAMNFLRCYGRGDFEHELVVHAPAKCGYEALDAPNVHIHPASSIVHSALARPWVDNVWMKRILEEAKPDVLFAMGSIAYPTVVPQLVLYHWPYAIYPEDEVWERMSLADRTSRRIRRWLFGRRAPFASHFAAQTETARLRLERLWGLSNVSVIPNAVSVVAAVAGAGRPTCLPEGVRADGKRVLLCLTRYYPHKNLEVLVELGQRIRAAAAPFVVLLTVSDDEGSEVSGLLRAIEREGLGDTIVNLGTVPTEQVPSLHAACDGLLLPTILESFSGTYVESMHYERPIFTSDRDFARDVCGEVAWYFDPHDPDDILSVLRAAFDDPAEMQRRVALGLERCEGFPTWPEVTARYVELLESAAAEGAT